MVGAHSQRQAKPVSFWRVWLPCFLLFWFLMVMWSLASPIGSGADEPTSLARSVAAVRGQFVGSPILPTSPSAENPGVRTYVTVPDTFAHYDDCFAMHPTESAACNKAGPLPASRAPTRITTLVGHYPPLYYLIVGLPSYLPGTSSVVYFMRAAGEAVNAALLSLAVFAIRRWARSNVMLLGLAFAISPMVMFFSSVVNPSGLEICSAICLWVTASIWGVDHPDSPPTGLLWTAAVSAAILIQARPASPAWPVMIAVALAPFLWKRRPLHHVFMKLRALRTRRELWPMILLVGASAMIAAAWFLVVHSFRMVGGNFPPHGTPESTLAKQSIEYMPGYLQQAVGVLGWLDTTLPHSVIHFWYLGVLLFLGFGLMLSRMRGRLSILLVMLFSFLVPTLGTLVDVHTHGFSSQGRYFLPVFVGLPIAAAAVLGRALRDRNVRLHPLVRRGVIRLGLTLVGGSDFIAFGVNLRRYLVGINGPWLPWNNPSGSWNPPLPGVWLDVLALIDLGVLFWLLGRPLLRRRSSVWSNPEVQPAANESAALPSP